jgi:hypothetical protein
VLKMFLMLSKFMLEASMTFLIQLPDLVLSILKPGPDNCNK